MPPVPLSSCSYTPGCKIGLVLPKICWLGLLIFELLLFPFRPLRPLGANDLLLSPTSSLLCGGIYLSSVTGTEEAIFAELPDSSRATSGLDTVTCCLGDCSFFLEKTCRASCNIFSKLPRLVSIFYFIELTI